MNDGVTILNVVSDQNKKKKIKFSYFFSFLVYITENTYFNIYFFNRSVHFLHYYYYILL